LEFLEKKKLDSHATGHRRSASAPNFTVNFSTVKVKVSQGQKVKTALLKIFRLQ